MTYTHIHNISFSYKILYVSLCITDYLIRLAFWEIRGRDCYKEITNSLMEDLNEMSRTYEGELATLKAELEQRSSTPSNMEAECVQLRP